MIGETPPCMNCEHRSVECHAKCKAYAEWKAARQEKEQAIRQARRKEMTLDDINWQARRRMATRKGRRRKE